MLVKQRPRQPTLGVRATPSCIVLAVGASIACTSDLGTRLRRSEDGAGIDVEQTPTEPMPTLHGPPLTAPSGPLTLDSGVDDRNPVVDPHPDVISTPTEPEPEPSTLPTEPEPPASDDAPTDDDVVADDDLADDDLADDDLADDDLADDVSAANDAGSTMATPDASLPLEPEPSTPDAGYSACVTPCVWTPPSVDSPFACTCPEPAEAGVPLDGCPDDPLKTEPGACGCGFTEVIFCSELSLALVHRYAFDGTGTTVSDPAGGADGTVIGTTLADGRVTLGGAGSGQYVDLPNGILSGHTDLTIEVWTTWSGGDPWQKVFDFGSSDGGEDVQGMGLTELFVTPRTEGDDIFRVGFKPNTGSEMSVSSTSILPTDTLTHIAVVFDDTNDRLSLYKDGIPVLTGQLVGTLSQIDDVNNWLGRSQWLGNPDYGGSIDEFRIYARALTADELAYSFGAGPDAAFIALR